MGASYHVLELEACKGRTTGANHDHERKQSTVKQSFASIQSSYATDPLAIQAAVA
jgi:hypothetical protein